MDRTRLLKIFQHLEKEHKHSRFQYLNLELMKPAVNLFSFFIIVIIIIIIIIIIIVIIIFMKWRILHRVYIGGRVNCYITHKHCVTFYRKNKTFFDGVFLNLNP